MSFWLTSILTTLTVILVGIAAALYIVRNSPMWFWAPVFGALGTVGVFAWQRHTERVIEATASCTNTCMTFLATSTTELQQTCADTCLAVATMF